MGHSHGGTTLLKSSVRPETSHLTDSATSTLLDPRADGRSLTRLLALGGIVGAPLFVVVLLVLGLVKPGFNAVVQMGSEESIGDLGWIQSANFLVTGVCFVVLAVGLWRGLGSRLSGRIGSALIAAAGIGLFGAGLFVTDPEYPPQTLHGILHSAVSAVTFLSLLIACLAFARRFWHDRRFAIYSIASGLVIPASIPAFNIAPGVIQRVMIAVVWTWITALALRLYAMKGEEPRQ